MSDSEKKAAAKLLRSDDETPAGVWLDRAAYILPFTITTDDVSGARFADGHLMYSLGSPASDLLEGASTRLQDPGNQLTNAERFLYAQKFIPYTRHQAEQADLLEVIADSARAWAKEGPQDRKAVVALLKHGIGNSYMNDEAERQTYSSALSNVRMDAFFQKLGTVFPSVTAPNDGALSLGLNVSARPPSSSVVTYRT